jgi:hypothetical protein
MKDFYDVNQLLSQKRFDQETLQLAISQTFKHRQTALKPNHPVFDLSFANDPARNKQWEAFLVRSKLSDSNTFPEVMQCIKEHLLPIYEQLHS